MVSCGCWSKLADILACRSPFRIEHRKGLFLLCAAGRPELLRVGSTIKLSKSRFKNFTALLPILPRRQNQIFEVWQGSDGFGATVVWPYEAGAVPLGEGSGAEASSRPRCRRLSNSRPVLAILQRAWRFLIFIFDLGQRKTGKFNHGIH